MLIHTFYLYHHKVGIGSRYLKPAPSPPVDEGDEDKVCLDPVSNQPHEII